MKAMGVKVTAWTPGRRTGDSEGTSGKRVKGDTAILQPNNDNDDGITTAPGQPEHRDNADAEISANDDDIVMIEIYLYKGTTTGELVLNVPAGIRVFKANGTLLTNYTLTTDHQNTRLYIEGLDDFTGADLSATYTPVDDSGTGDPAGASAIGSVTGQVRLLPLDIVPDFNRDGKIDDADRNHVTAAKPYRFWINDDDDKTQEDHATSDDGSYNGAEDDAVEGMPDFNTDRIRSKRDLVDWFPLFLDIGNALDVMPPDKYDYFLCHEDANLKFIPCNFLAANTGDSSRPSAVQRIGDVAQVVVKDSNAVRPDDSTGAPVNWVSHITANGTKLQTGWLTDIKADKNKAIILITAAGKTVKPLKLRITRKDGTKLIEWGFPLSIDSVKKMYRWINLRSVCESQDKDKRQSEGTDPTKIDEPANWKDKDCVNKAFVFIHGYAVSLEESRGAAAEIWKRMFWSGSNAKFYAVSWRGNQGSLPLFGVPPDYWINVYNAFKTSPEFANAMGGIRDPLYIASHSLGGMVTSSAMADHRLKVNRFYMMNSAVPTEAFVGTMRDKEENETIAMTASAWRGHIDRAELQAARYADLFKGKDDNRRCLTWQGRFANLDKTKVYQLYSSGDEVCQPNKNRRIPNFGDALFSEYVWVAQELYKGLKTKWFAQVLGGGNEPAPQWKSMTGGWLRSDIPWASAPTEWADKVATPMFKKFNPYINGKNVHGLEGSATLAGFDDPTYHQSAYLYRAALLAQDVPALTWPAGSIKVKEFYKTEDLMKLKDDMEKETGARWPRYNCPKDQNGSTVRWYHGDYRAQAYLYTYPLYDLFVKDGRLK